VVYKRDRIDIAGSSHLLPAEVDRIASEVGARVDVLCRHWHGQRNAGATVRDDYAGGRCRRKRLRRDFTFHRIKNVIGTALSSGE